MKFYSILKIQELTESPNNFQPIPHTSMKKDLQEKLSNLIFNKKFIWNKKGKSFPIDIFYGKILYIFFRYYIINYSVFDLFCMLLVTLVCFVWLHLDWENDRFVGFVGDVHFLYIKIGRILNFNRKAGRKFLPQKVPSEVPVHPHHHISLHDFLIHFLFTINKLHFFYSIKNSMGNLTNSSPLSKNIPKILEMKSIHRSFLFFCLAKL
jgi:hypothetical protein